MPYLLDTNILSHAAREPRGVVADKIRGLGGAAVYTSVIVAGEMRFGALRRASERVTAQVEAVLGTIRIAPIDRPVDEVYGRLRWALERAGTPIGANDLLIAAQAVNDRSIVVTANTREFGRVPGLSVENWLSD